MARTFVAASSQFLENTTPPLIVPPFTMAAWVKPATLTGGNTGNNPAILTIEATASVDRHLLFANGTNVFFQTYNGSSAMATSSTAPSLGVWQHVTGVMASVASRAVYLNGAGKGTDATSLTLGGTLNRFEVGSIYNTASRLLFWDGDIAEVGVWNVALTDLDVAILASGISPLLVRPDALVFYAPLLNGGSPEPDIIGRRNLTVTGATLATHPRILRYASLPSVSYFRSTSVNIVGVTRDASGAPLASVTVKLFKTSDNSLVNSTVSDGSGVYSFTVTPSTAYYLLAYKSGTPDVAGTTLNTLVGA
jgi:hypothetical protein